MPNGEIPNLVMIAPPGMLPGIITYLKPISAGIDVVLSGAYYPANQSF
jgi:hypothetical protein